MWKCACGEYVGRDGGCVRSVRLRGCVCMGRPGRRRRSGTGEGHPEDRVLFDNEGSRWLVYSRGCRYFIHSLFTAHYRRAQSFTIFVMSSAPLAVVHNPCVMHPSATPSLTTRSSTHDHPTQHPTRRPPPSSPPYATPSPRPHPHPTPNLAAISLNTPQGCACRSAPPIRLV